VIAPAYLALALILRDRSDRRTEFLILSAWGAIYSGFMVAGGPWREIDPLVNWLLVAGAGMTWFGYRIFVSRRTAAPTSDLARAA
jgi:hypothetical protein